MSQVIIKNAFEGIDAAHDPSIQVSLSYSVRGTHLYVSAPGSIQGSMQSFRLQFSRDAAISILARKLCCLISKYLAERGKA